MSAGRTKEEWLSEQEVKDFFDYHIQRVGDELYPSSYILGAICTAIDTKEYLKHNRKDIYEIIEKWDCFSLNEWVTMLGDSEMHGTQSEECLWMLEPIYKLETSEKRLELAFDIDNEEYAHDDLCEILAHYLHSIGVKNNILEYADLLNSGGYCTVLSRIKIEKKSVYTSMANKETRIKLMEQYGSVFNLFKYNFYEVYVGDEINMSNQKFAFLIDALKKRGFVRDDWQSMISNCRLAKTMNGKYITRRDLSEALKGAKETAENFIYGKPNEKQQEYGDIKRFVESL